MLIAAKNILDLTKSLGEVEFLISSDTAETGRCKLPF